MNTSATKADKFTVESDDMGTTVLTRAVQGPITNPERLKALARIVSSEFNNWREHCGHSYDCCGCEYSVDTEMVLYTGQNNELRAKFVQTRHINV